MFTHNMQKAYYNVAHIKLCKEYNKDNGKIALKKCKKNERKCKRI